MCENKFDKLFRDFGIEVEPLNERYDPNEYGKWLMSGFNKKDEDISYSNSTEVIDQNLVISVAGSN